MIMIYRADNKSNLKYHQKNKGKLDQNKLLLQGFNRSRSHKYSITDLGGVDRGLVDQLKLAVNHFRLYEAEL